MNRGIIFGCVRYGEGSEQGMPYKGALVTLRNIKSNRGMLKICTTGEPKESIIDHRTTDADGEFVFPYFWEGNEIGDQFNSSVFLVSAISPTGVPAASGSASGRLSFGPDWSRLVKMIPGGIMSAGKSKLINKAATKHFKNMAGNFSGLSSIESLFQSHDPKKHLSTENLKAIGSCEIWI